MESSTTAPSDKQPPSSSSSTVDSCKKQRVTVCQNHNKPLLRQSLTGFPSGSCVTSWDNETAARRPTTCSLSFTWFITPFLTMLLLSDRKRGCVIYKHGVATWLIPQQATFVSALCLRLCWPNEQIAVFKTDISIVDSQINGFSPFWSDFNHFKFFLKKVPNHIKRV